MVDGMHMVLCGDKPDEECQDKVDDDDGKVDCDDEDCSTYPACVSFP